MTIHLLYPADPCNPKRSTAIDFQWQEEFNAAKDKGLSVSCVDTDDFNNIKLDLLQGKTILYRGWMLSPDAYSELHSKLSKVKASFLITPEMYKATHYLPEWYKNVEKYTAKTVVVANLEDVTKTIHQLNWPNGYFLKDFVKSLKTGAGSSIFKAADAVKVIEQMKHFRGQIEGGICIREHLDIIQDSETRYFARNGIVYAPNNESPPAFVQEIANMYANNFISIDVSKLTNGKHTLVEIGNGQVSDYVGWDVDVFTQMLSSAFNVYNTPTLTM